MPVGPSGPIGDGSHPSDNWYEPANHRDWDDEAEARREEEGW